MPTLCELSITKSMPRSARIAHDFRTSLTKNDFDFHIQVFCFEPLGNRLQLGLGARCEFDVKVLNVVVGQAIDCFDGRATELSGSGFALPTRDRYPPLRCSCP